MNRKAFFCDGTDNYVIPSEPGPLEMVEFLFRTAEGDVDKVSLCARNQAFEMTKKETYRGFDYYHIFMEMGTDTFMYYFQIQKGEEVAYYDQSGPTYGFRSEYAFKLCPGFSTPGWAKGAVMYQIFTDRFCNGDPSNDVLDREYCYIDEHVKKIEDWGQYPAQSDIRNFYGGDLKGVWDKLDYLQDLGVEVIYFNPLFVSPSNHKYDIQDYDYIDPHYGVIVKDGGRVLKKNDLDNRNATKYQKRVTDFHNLEASNKFFADLVAEIHKRGMKVIIDGVFNHCGSFNKWLDKELIYEDKEGFEPGAYVSSDSPYRYYFDFAKNDEKEWPHNDTYDGWWGHSTLPKLNYEASRDLEEYILRIGQKWVSEPYNVDGWRLDVAADLGHSPEFNHNFWKKFRKAVKEANPNAIVLAEHYGDPQSWLMGDEWDTVMNYDAFMEPVTWFLTGMEKHSDSENFGMRGNAEAFVAAMTYNMARYTTSSLQVAMNELSNHDHSRFLTRTNHFVGRLGNASPEDANKNVNKAVMREAVVMQMTWVGAPTLYYGDEAGVCGFTDPDNRRTYPWGHEDKELIAFHRDMIRIHRENQTLKTGSLKMLNAQWGVLAYARFDKEHQIIVIVNNSDSLKQVTVPVWQAECPMKGSLRRLVYTYEKGYTTEHEEFLIMDGEIVVNMGSHSALVLKNMGY